MSGRWKILMAGAVVAALAFVGIGAVDSEPQTVEQQTVESQPLEVPRAVETPRQDDLRVVLAGEVCMVNDRFFGVAQIPVPVGQQTYYGCCEGCKKRLAEDEGVRFAIDPATGERVDKASALIAARADGSVLYFADEETLGRYRGAGP